jgi:hypothetical protein
MPTTFKWYANGLVNTMNGNVDLDTSALKIALFTSSHTPNQNTDSVYTATNEVVGTGYTAGGVTLAKSVVNDAGVAEFRVGQGTVGTDITWPNSTITARHAIIYADLATKYLIGYCTFGDGVPENVSSSNGTFTIDIAEADGCVLRITPS